MTQTTNIGLKKIDGSENWRQIFDYYNDSADKTDSAVAAVQDGLAIVANGDTHAAVAEGQFVYVRNHSTLAEGLYKASSAIQINGGLTTSNLTADGSGGLNNLQEQVTSLNSKFSPALMSTDANDAIVSGTYYLTGDCANRPADWCIMTVIAFNGETLSQTATSVITGKTYVRSKSVNGWTSWEELALNSNSIKYGTIKHGPVSVTDGTPIVINNPYASHTCIGVFLYEGGGNGGYARGYTSFGNINGTTIRFVPTWTDTNVSMTFTVLYLE